MQLRASKLMAWIWHHHKHSQIPICTTPLWRARRDDRNGYIICIHRSLDERDMHRTSCGPSGTHSRSRGDALAHRMPCGHDTSSIQRSTPSTNQEPVHGSKGPLPHRNELETPQTPPNRPWDPPGSHLDENRLERSCLDVGRSPIRLNPSGGLSRHTYTSRLVVTSQRRCQVLARISTPKACSSFSWKIRQLGPHSSAPRVTTSLVPWWHPR
jgi:hypothetical protein